MAPESGIRLDEARLAGMDPGRKQAIRAEIAEGVGAISIGGDASEATINTDVTIEGNRYALSLTPEIIDALRPVLAAPLSNLPPAPAHFVDRAEDVTALLRALASGAESQAITALRGIGGIGKTTLAVLVARKLALHYPSAQILIKLRGTDPEPVSARAAMEDVIRRFAPTADLPDDEEDIAEIYRDLLGKNKSLLILDNARDAGQVAPLLPPAPSAAIVTTRRAVDLPGLEVRRLDNLPRAAAVALLRALLAGGAIPVPDLEALAAACADHPLALTVAGGYLRNRLDRLTCADYAARISANRDELKLANVADYDVMGSLDQSLRMLVQDDPNLAEQWRDLSVFPGDFDTAAANAVWAGEVDEAAIAAAAVTLERLLDLGFIETAEDASRFRLHDLMRDLAGRGQDDDRFDPASRRHAAHFLMVLAAAHDLYLDESPGGVMAGLALFDQERHNIVSGQSWAADRRDPASDVLELVDGYAGTGAHVLNLRLHARGQIDWLTAAIDAARAIGNRQHEGVHLGNLGTAHGQLGELRTAIDYFEPALEIAREIGDRRGEGNTLGNLGNAYQGLGEPRTAIDYLEPALKVFREIGNQRGEGAALGNLGNAYAGLDEALTAIDYYGQALEISRDIGDRRGEGNNFFNLGDEHEKLGNRAAALDCVTKAVTIGREIEDPDLQKALDLLAHLRSSGTGSGARGLLRRVRAS